MSRAVEAIGAEVVLLRRDARTEPAFDSLLLTGGPTPSAEVFGTAASRDVDDPDDVSDIERDIREFALLDRSLAVGRPVLGVCRGMQLIAIHAGGTLVPLGQPREHAGVTAGRREPTRHTVELAPGSRLARAVGRTLLSDCSSQHRVGVDLACSDVAQSVGWAHDGEVEALEYRHGDAVGVLWHPEDNPALTAQRNVFRLLIEAVSP